MCLRTLNITGLSLIEPLKKHHGDLLNQVVRNLRVLHEVDEQVYSVVPRQRSIAVDRYVEYEWEGLVDVLGIKQL